MTIEAIKKKLQTEEYDFLRKDKNLGNQMMILTLGGSHAYGTDKEGSDLDAASIAPKCMNTYFWQEHFSICQEFPANIR